MAFGMDGDAALTPRERTDARSPALLPGAAAKAVEGEYDRQRPVRGDRRCVDQIAALLIPDRDRPRLAVEPLERRARATPDARVRRHGSCGGEDARLVRRRQRQVAPARAREHEHDKGETQRRLDAQSNTTAVNAGKAWT